ncbi:MAG TPA: hypothetical protein VFE65_32650 [Pseudonocardia sp.]|jgi:hypothetical protein|nr:hypothetical protein [Pseudonocardia sp.]
MDAHLFTERGYLSRIEGDYLDVTGVRSVLDLIRSVSAAVGVSVGAWERNGVFPLLRLAPQWEIFLEYACSGPATARIAIADLSGDPIERGHLALRIRHAMDGVAGWRLSHTSDSDLAYE